MYSGDTKDKGRTLKFGIMCNSYSFQRWQGDSIRLLLQYGKIKPDLLIINANPIERKHFFRKIFSYPYNQLFFRLYTRFHSLPSSMMDVDLESDLKKVPFIKCRTIKRGYSEYFCDDDINKIRSYQLDFVLRFGFGVLKGKVLNAAKYGIWSFHHDDELKYRGVPPGFWEIYNDDNINGSILQKITDKLDSGVILKKGYFRTIKYSHYNHLNHLLTESARWPLQVCIDILNDVAEYINRPPSITKAPIYRWPGNLQMLGFALKILMNKYRFHVRELFKVEEWNVGIIERPIQEIMDNKMTHPKIHWLPNPPKGKYYADPFIFIQNDKVYVLYETFDYSTKSGNISLISYNPQDKSITQLPAAIKKEFHLSYPYVIEHENEIYCMPESCNNRRVDIYKFDCHKETFNYFATLLNNVDAVDGTLFKYKDLWWLMFTSKEQADLNLHAYYADDIFGPYKSHFNNPIKTDVRSSRPAGTPFHHNGHFYRPSQDCSKTYGEKICINEIKKITPYEFEETLETVIEPFKDSKYNNAMHTMASAGGFTVIDGKRFVFIKDEFKHQLKMKIKRLLGANG